MKFLAPLFFLLSCFCAAEEFKPELRIPTSVRCDPSVVIEGCVNMATGAYFEIDKSLKIRGPVPLEWTRLHYSSDNNTHPWTRSFKFDTALIVDRHNPKEKRNKYQETLVVWIQEDNGTVVRFCNHGSPRTPIDLTGYINTSGEAPSGKYDLRNYRLEHDEGPNRLVLTTGSGERRYFVLSDEQYMHVAEEPPKPPREPIFGQHFHGAASPKAEWKRSVDAVRAANKTYFKRHFSLEKIVRPDGIVIRDRQAYLGSKSLGGFTRSAGRVESSDGRTLKYNWQQFSLTGEPTLFYTYDEAGRVIERAGPDGRAFKVRYENGMVSSLWRSREKGSSDLLWSFAYKQKPPPAKVELPDHVTWNFAEDDEGNRVYFGFREEHLVAKIFMQGETLIRGELFQWYNGNLAYKAILDKSGPLCAVIYRYDFQGNVIKETLYGNLSGHCAVSLTPDRSRNVYSDIEAHTIIRTYSIDGRNLLLSEKEGNKTVQYRYRDHSDLLTERLIYDGELLLLQEQFDYDEILQPNLVQTELGIATRISGYDEKQRSFGLPKDVVELAKGKNLLQTEIVYGSYNLPIEKRVSDSAGVYRYSLFYEYDKEGRLIKETDPQGQATSYSYDANNNIVLKGLPDHEELCSYDLANQLTSIQKDGLAFRTEYNARGLSVAEVQPTGARTDYTYDALGHATSITYPEVQTPSGPIRPIVKKEYNALGNCIRETNALGDVTTRRFSARGQLAEERYPDGSYTSFKYSLGGHLIEKRTPDGLITTYENDALGRVTKELTGDKIKLTFYQGRLKTKEVDPLGVATEYIYDDAARLIEQRTLNQRTTYDYDTLSRCIQKQEWLNANSYRATKWEYNLLDQPIEERVEDESGQIALRKTYAYDASGNLIEEITHDAENAYATRSSYNVLGEATSLTDALGHVTITKYDRNGPLKTTTTDPLGNQTVTSTDPAGNTISVEKYNSAQQLTQRTEYRYDLASRRTHEIHSVIAHGKILRTITNERVFDSMGRLIQLSESDSAKVTHYHYNALGQLEAITKPSGKKISYSYDEYGRLSRHSGPFFSDTYTYDLADRPISITHLDGTTTSREYDLLGNLTSESLANGLNLTYLYDAFNRLTSVTLPDASQIHYTRSPLYLKAVSRENYSHKYTDYDQRGHCRKTELPFALGNATASYDALGRLRSLTSPHSDLVVDNFDAAGNLLAETLTDPVGITFNTYSYDDLYQLSKEPGHTYNRDSLHNPLAIDGSTCESSSLNQLTSLADRQLLYDADGNLIRITAPGFTRLFSYDGLNRLIRIEQEQPTQFTLTFSYDADHRRLSKTLTLPSWLFGPTTSALRYLYQDNSEIGAVNPQNKIVELRLLGRSQGAEIGGAVAIELDGQPYVPIHDQRGNTTVLISPNGSPAEIYRYSAFGETKIYAPSGKRRTSSSLGFCWRYASKRTDEETGLIYFGRRYYDPQTTTWVTPDPKGLDEGPNLYAYCIANPLRYCDPWGLASKRWDRFKQQSATFGRTLKSYPGQFWNHAVDTWRDPRFQGALRAAGGFIEAGVGAGLTYMTGGLAAPIGWALIAHGLDNAIAGSYTAITGRSRLTVTEHLLQKAGMSHTAAAFTNDAFAIFGALGGAGLARTVQRFAPPSTALASSWSTQLRATAGQSRAIPKFAIDQLSLTASAADRGMLSAAGRSLTKHGAGARAGNSLFPPARGNPGAINLQAQNIVDEILTAPGSTIRSSYRGRFGDTIEITSTDGRGIVYSSEGQFLFFKE